MYERKGNIRDWCHGVRFRAAGEREEIYKASKLNESAAVRPIDLTLLPGRKAFAPTVASIFTLAFHHPTS